MRLRNSADGTDESSFDEAALMNPAAADGSPIDLPNSRILPGRLGGIAAQRDGSAEVQSLEMLPDLQDVDAASGLQPGAKVGPYVLLDRSAPEAWLKYGWPGVQTHLRRVSAAAAQAVAGPRAALCAGAGHPRESRASQHCALLRCGNRCCGRSILGHGVRPGPTTDGSVWRRAWVF